jgi:hypothetical protein
VGLAMLGIIVTAFIPYKISDIRKGVEGWGAKPLEPINKSCREIKAEGLGLYLRNQSNVYYYDIHNGEFKIFDQSGTSPYHKGVSLKPLDESDLNLCAEREKKETAKKTPDSPPASGSEPALVPFPPFTPNKPEPAPALPKSYEAPKSTEIPYADRFIADKNFMNNPNTTEVAIVVVDAKTKLILNDSFELANQLKSNSVKPTASLFNQQFVTSGVFENIFTGNSGKISELNLSRYADYLLLAKKTAAFGKEKMSSMGGYSGHVTIDACVISTVTGSRNCFSTEGDGVTFDQSGETAMNSATSIAQKKLIEKIPKLGG